MTIKLLRSIIVFTVCLIFVIPVKAQSQRKQTIVMTDGSRFPGIVLSDTSDFIKVRIKSPRVIFLARSAIDTVEGMDLFFRNKEPVRGYYVQVSASNLVGSSEPGKKIGISLHFSNGYQFRNGLSLGAGSGLEDFKEIMVPVYLALRYQPFKRRVSPYVWAKTGYCFSTSAGGYDYSYYYGPEPEHSGGSLLNGGVGLELYSWNRNSICFGIGYRYQKSSINSSVSGTRYDYFTEYNRMEIQIAFVFR